MLPEELIAEVRRLQIVSRSIVSEVFTGEYESAFKGRGLEFAEVRQYQPGDDTRLIDWNVTARTGTPHIKENIEERELTVMLVVDLSASGLFGSTGRRKNSVAAELCAVLGFVASNSNDKVGLLVFTEDVELFIAPKKGSRHVLRVVREVLSFEPAQRGTNLAAPCDFLGRMLKKRAIVFFVSDFLDQGDVEPLRALAARHDVVALRIADPHEFDLPKVGLLQLRDAETGESRVIDTSSGAVRRRFRAASKEFERCLEDAFRRRRVDYVSITTGEPYAGKLTELFHKREGWRSRGRRPR